MTELLHSTNTVAIDWPMHRRLMMVLIGYVPFLMAVLVIGSIIVTVRQWGIIGGLGSGVAVIYLLPPLAYRIQSVIMAPQSGRHTVTSSAFLRWWLSAQWQVTFNRLGLIQCRSQHGGCDCAFRGPGGEVQPPFL